MAEIPALSGSHSTVTRNEEGAMVSARLFKLFKKRVRIHLLRAADKLGTLLECNKHLLSLHTYFGRPTSSWFFCPASAASPPHIRAIPALYPISSAARQRSESTVAMHSCPSASLSSANFSVAQNDASAPRAARTRTGMSEGGSTPSPHFLVNPVYTRRISKRLGGLLAPADPAMHAKRSVCTAVRNASLRGNDTPARAGDGVTPRTRSRGKVGEEGGGCRRGRPGRHAAATEDAAPEERGSIFWEGAGGRHLSPRRRT